jgi:hypothetical protein
MSARRTAETMPERPAARRAGVHHGIMMLKPKVRTTLTIDDSVLRAVEIRAARTGRGDGEVIEEALRRELGLDLLERLWQRNELSEDEATALAVEAQHETRRRTR